MCWLISGVGGLERCLGSGVCARSLAVWVVRC